MGKKAVFFIDDVIWVFRDLARERPKSLFNNPFMKLLKNAHDKYGLKTQLNVFYKTDIYYGNDEFDLCEMTDAYKSEWESASDWLKIAFHSRQEFPDYPYINASYKDVFDDYKAIEREILRFAGKNTIAKGTTPHWRPISKEACCALRDCGVELLSATYGKKIEFDGDSSSLPYGHAGRLLCNQKPETKIFIRETKDKAISKSLCGYNHISEEERNLTKDNFDSITDKETGLKFKDLGGNGCLNLLTKEEVLDYYTSIVGKDFVCYGTHEQYFYPDYFAYQPDYGEKLMLAAKILSENGYEFIFSQDLL